MISGQYHQHSKSSFCVNFLPYFHTSSTINICINLSYEKAARKILVKLKLGVILIKRFFPRKMDIFSVFILCLVICLIAENEKKCVLRRKKYNRIDCRFVIFDVQIKIFTEKQKKVVKNLGQA